ncbi:MAG TPA: hypothetical protein VK152_09680, partial [Paludibacter sp.]|nr:hypothetical protein [Paludibacter sp.]
MINFAPMNKTTILLSFIFLGMSKLMAFPPDSVSTGYKHGEFVTTCQVHVNASDSICTAVTHSFDNQLKNNFDALFGWALKGMNLRNEEKKNDLLIFYFKSTRYNKTTNIIRGIGDITVPGIMTSPDIFVDIRITTKKYSNGKTCFYIDFINSNGFIKNMSCIFSILPERGK